MDTIKYGKIDFELINSVNRRAQLYERGEELFWDDPHISKGMLEAHLNRDLDLASYNHDTINKICNWIADKINISAASKVLDLGCGPGLYCSHLSRKGANITGIDYSKRSIAYARKEAQENRLNIDYIYMNYLEIDYENEFDLIMIVYYDFAALSYDDRNTLLLRINRALKKGGYFIFDVMTPKAKKEEAQRWSVVNGGGFWKPNAYLELFQSFEYEENIMLSQYCIIDENSNMSIYRIWDKYYDINEITSVLNEYGFMLEEAYSDLRGKALLDESETMALFAKKQ